MTSPRVDATRLATPPKHETGDPMTARAFLAIALPVAVSYYVGARIGFSLTFPPLFPSTLWIPNGILLGALLLTPIRSWWIVLLAAFPAHLIVELQEGVQWLTPLFYLSNVGEILIAATLLRWTVGGPPWFDTFGRVSAFAVATLIATILSTLLAAPLVLHGARRAVYWDVFRIRLWSNVLAMLTVTPAMLSLGRAGGLRLFRRMAVSRYVETGIFIVALLTTSIVAFGWQKAGPGADATLLYLPVPLLIWAAVRFGPGGVSASLLLVALLTLGTAVHGRGPFITRSPGENALAIQLFFVAGSVGLLSLAAAVQQREQAQQTARENQESARESRQQLELAMRAAVMGSWEWRIKDSVIFVSDESARVLGLAPNEHMLTTERFYEIVHPDDRVCVSEALSRGVLDKNSTEIEFRVVRGDGSMRWVRTKGRVVEDRGGAITRMLGLGADVTLQKKADALRVAQNSILEMVAVGALLPQVLSALAGLIESQIDGVRCSVFPLDAAQVNGTLGAGGPAPRPNSHTTDCPVQEANHGARGSWSATISSRDGVTIGLCDVYGHENWTPSEEERRLIDSVTAMASVAIERSQADAALRLSHQRYRLATTGGNVGVWDWDLESNHVYVDPYINSILGYEDNEIDDTLEAWVGLIHPEDVERVMAFAGAQLAADQPSYECEYRMRHKDGSVRIVFLRANVIRDADGRAVRVVGTTIDITERRRARAELEEQQRQLAHLGRAAVLGELSGALAHELNQPLSAILANAAAAQRSLTQMPSCPTVTLIDEILTDIIHDDHRAAAVIARLRSLLKKGELRVQRLDLNEVVSDVLEIVHSDLIERKVSVDCRLADGLPAVYGDRVQAQQVLLNLILNACDAMSANAQRDRVLKIVTEIYDGGSRLSIVDRGPGVPEATMERIFEPFVTSKADGLGLGLAICRSIMRAHGGRLWATNNPGAGATFSVEFPRERCAVLDLEAVLATRPDVKARMARVG